MTNDSLSSKREVECNDCSDKGSSDGPCAWVYLAVYPSEPGPYYVKELAEDWDAMDEQQRQKWLQEVSVEFGWGGSYTYEETKRAGK